jgi:putative restriction endonuclease
MLHSTFSPAEPHDVAEERARRMSLWSDLESQKSRVYTPALLNDLRIFYGGRGIWVHQEKTKGVGASANGITVGLLHTGSTYADDLHDDGVIYHYPRTAVPGRDASEIEATKAAMLLRLPVFVVSYPYPKASTRHVQLGWVDGYDDTERWFLVSFGQQQSATIGVPDDTTFVGIVSKKRKLQTTKARVGQQRFKFQVFKYYGGRCAVCDLDIKEALDAAHIIPDEAGGTDHPRNGLVLCADHHRAFDRNLFAINPETLCIEARPGGPNLEALQIIYANLAHLSKFPHPDALHWRWKRVNPSETNT